MDTKDYFKHIRSLGAFPATGALALAREASALDKAAAEKRATVQITKISAYSLRLLLKRNAAGIKSVGYTVKPSYGNGLNFTSAQPRGCII